MSISFDFSEVAALAVTLGAAASADLGKVRQAVAKATYDTEADGKANAAVDTGTMRNSITSTVSGYTGEVGPTVEYAPFVEYGTSRMGPQPFMGPALEKNVAPFIDGVADAAGDML